MRQVSFTIKFFCKRVSDPGTLPDTEHARPASTAESAINNVHGPEQLSRLSGGKAGTSFGVKPSSGNEVVDRNIFAYVFFLFFFFFL